MTFVLPQDSSMDNAIEAPLRGPVGAARPPRPAPARQTPAQTSGRAEASYLAHDTRNWLTVLQMYCDLLRSQGAVSSGHQNWIDELSGAVERGQGLVVSLLDSVQESSREADSCAAVEKAPAARTPVPLQVADALGRRMALLERMAGDRIQVELGGAFHTAKVAIEESAFERILYNLAGNAIEAMPGGGRLRLTVRTGRDGGDREDAATADTVLLRVLDTGAGIRPERLAAIFEAGVSSKAGTENNRPSHGFGLAIVRELTERAGGRVRVRSHPGRGSCFELQFPRVS